MMQGRAPLHLVSAWAAQNHLVLGQTRTQAHSNEITAIPQLLALLELRGCIITIDAMGCQTEIAQQIVDGGADYLLAVKSNQGELYGNIQDLFQMAAQEGSLEDENPPAIDRTIIARWTKATDAWRPGSAG